MAQNYIWPSTSATLSGGTVSILNGTVSTVGTVSNVAGGTVAISTGTLATITSISNLAAGTVAVSTIAAGTVAVSTGTIASIGNIAAGTIAISTGTLASITNLAGGTVAISGSPTVNLGTLVVSGSTSSGTGAIVTQDVSGYSMVSVMHLIPGSATITFKGSNDGTNYFNVSMGYISGSGAPTVVQSSSGISFAPVAFRFFKVDVTAWSNGTASATLFASHGESSDPALRSISVTNQVSVIGVGGTIANIAGGTIAVNEVTSATATLTAVTGSTTSFQILATNANRKGAALYNSTGFNLFMTYGGTSGTSVGAYSVALANNAYYEFPGPKVFSGSVTGITSGTGGTMTVTEFT